jgi:hypothetical protein
MDVALGFTVGCFLSWLVLPCCARERYFPPSGFPYLDGTYLTAREGRCFGVATKALWMENGALWVWPQDKICSLCPGRQQGAIPLDLQDDGRGTPLMLLVSVKEQGVVQIP